MKQVDRSELLGSNNQSVRQQPLVFLDTNVILGYLRGDKSAVQLFAAEASGRIRFAINPIVLQELLLRADAVHQPAFEKIRDHLNVLPINFTKAEALLPKFQSLGSGPAHSNDILILSSADQCDFLVTKDLSLMKLVASEKPLVVTPEALVTKLQAA